MRNRDKCCLHSGVKLCGILTLLYGSFSAQSQSRSNKSRLCPRFMLQVKYCRGNTLLIEPAIEVEVIIKKVSGNGRDINLVIDSSFEGQCLLARTQEERTYQDTALEMCFTIVAWLR